MIADWKTEKHFIYKPRKEIKESQWRKNFIVILQCRFQLLSEQKNASVCPEHKTTHVPHLHNIHYRFIRKLTALILCEIGLDFLAPAVLCDTGAST